MSDLKKGEELNLNITGLSSEGMGIAKVDDGFVIFVEKTIPGDVVKAKIKKKKTAYAVAEVIEEIEKSPERISPRCRYFGTCGGCKVQYIEYSGQLSFKTTVVKDAFERIGGFENFTVANALPSDDIYYYRNKMEFSFSDDKWMEKKEIDKPKEPFALGLHIPGFHSKILDIEECHLQSAISSGIVNFSRDFFKSRNISIYSTATHSGFLRFLVIRQSKNTDDLMINFVTYNFDDELMNEYSAGLEKEFPAITTFVNSVTTRKAQVAFGEQSKVIFGNGFILENMNFRGRTYIFKISPNSFFQTNTKQSEKLFATALDFAELKDTDRLLDLYCGAGTISLLASGFVKDVTGVELIEDAIADAKINAERNQVDNAEFIVSDIKDYLKEFVIKGNEAGINKVILDPPRSGLHPEICEILSETDFEKIVYVSCNPATQARDVKLICEKGKYVIEKIQPVDMFPHTYHIENVVSLIPVGR